MEALPSTYQQAERGSSNHLHNRKVVESRADWKTEAIPTNAFVVVPTRDETKVDLFSRENGLQGKLRKELEVIKRNLWHVSLLNPTGRWVREEREGREGGEKGERERKRVGGENRELSINELANYGWVKSEEVKEKDQIGLTLKSQMSTDF